MGFLLVLSKLTKELLLLDDLMVCFRRQGHLREATLSVRAGSYIHVMSAINPGILAATQLKIGLKSTFLGDLAGPHQTLRLVRLGFIVKVLLVY